MHASTTTASWFGAVLPLYAVPLQNLGMLCANSVQNLDKNHKLLTMPCNGCFIAGLRGVVSGPPASIIQHTTIFPKTGCSEENYFNVS
jgi:hypothetical protein